MTDTKGILFANWRSFLRWKGWRWLLMNKYYCTWHSIEKWFILLQRSSIGKIIYSGWWCMAYSLFGQITRNLIWNRYSLTFLGQKITFERLDLIRDDTEWGIRCWTMESKCCQSLGCNFCPGNFKIPISKWSDPRGTKYSSWDLKLDHNESLSYDPWDRSNRFRHQNGLKGVFWVVWITFIHVFGLIAFRLLVILHKMFL